MTSTSKSVEQAPAETGSVDNFISLVRAGIECWSRAGEVLVKLVANNPNVYSQIINRNPSITFEMLVAFERMGRKQLYPALLMDSSPGAKRLLQLPYEVQERYSKEPIDVFLENNGTDLSTTKKYLKELTGQEAVIVFDQSGVRSPLEQKAFVEKHGRRGRPRKIQQQATGFLGSYLLKLSPSGSLIAERVSDKKLATNIVLHEKEGVQQCVINLVKNTANPL